MHRLRGREALYDRVEDAGFGFAVPADGHPFLAGIGGGGPQAVDWGIGRPVVAALASKGRPLDGIEPLDTDLALDQNMRPVLAEPQGGDLPAAVRQLTLMGSIQLFMGQYGLGQ